MSWQSLAPHLERWYSDPNAFVTELWDVTPEEWQVKALEGVRDHPRVSIRSGHGVGKTTLEAWATLWFLLTRKPALVVATANSQDQLRDVVFRTIGQWAARLPEPLRGELDVTSERVWLKSAPQENYGVARTASKEKPEALQGFHEKNMLFIMEEASGIPNEVVEVGQGALSTPGAKLLMCGNPTRNSGYFYDSFHKLRNSFHKIHVSSEDVERARGHIQDIIDRYGLESNQYRVRVLGEFPLEGDDILIPLHLVESAVHRRVEPLDIYRTVWGVDPARYGDDRTALAKRRGNELLCPIQSWSNYDTIQSARFVMEQYEATHTDLRPYEILVDEIGIGAGVLDSLRENGLPARGVNVAERPSNVPRFRRLRDELWWRAREWFERRNCIIPDQEEFISEISDVTYEVEPGGKVVVESKKDMKERGGKSPDLADAFVLTFAGGLEKIEEHIIDRYKRTRQSNRGGWMAA